MKASNGWFHAFFIYKKISYRDPSFLLVAPQYVRIMRGYPVRISQNKNYGGLIMCTAATYQTKDFYFGRTLDNDFSYNHYDKIYIQSDEFLFSYLSN